MVAHEKRGEEEKYPALRMQPNLFHIACSPKHTSVSVSVVMGNHQLGIGILVVRIVQLWLW